MRDPPGVLHRCLSGASARLRRGLDETRLRLAAPPGGGGPLAVFLPAAGREGAALLRIWTVAGAIRREGWRTAVIPPGLGLAARRRVLAALAPDVLVMQGVRHALNRPELYPGLPVVLDMDDADFHLPHLAAAVAGAMPRVAGVIAGSGYVARWCRERGAATVRVIWTGAPVSARRRPPQAGRPPVVAWAQSRPEDYGEEAALVRRVAAGLARRHPGVRLRLFDRGPRSDPAFAESFRAPGLTVEWVEKARYRDYLALFDDVALGLAPISQATPFCRGKSFGKVLAYLDRGVPVIASDAIDHGRFFRSGTGVITNDEASWIAAAAGLLGDAGARQDIADAAFAAFRDRLSTAAAAARSAAFLDEVRRGAAGGGWCTAASRASGAGGAAAA